MYMAWFDIGSFASLFCSTPDHPLPPRERRRPIETCCAGMKRKGEGNGHPEWGLLRLVPWILRDPAFLTFVYSP